MDKKGFVIKGVQQYSPQETYDKCIDGILMLDIRAMEMSRFKYFDVPEVLHCPWRKLDQYLDSIPKDREVIIADAAGVNGMDLIGVLQNKGFNNLSNMAGGLVEWERDGLPVVINKKERLSGSCVCQLKPRESGKK